MVILVTGKNGFIAKNIIEAFSKSDTVISISHNDSVEKLYEKCSSCEFVFHTAAVQRSENLDDFIEGNIEYTKRLVSVLENVKNPVPLLFTTSVGIDRPCKFSETKLAAESIIRNYGNKNNVSVYIYKLNHIFGKFAKPDFNNVIATFCSHMINGQPIMINNPGTILEFTYIDDLIEDFNNIVKNMPECSKGYLSTSIKYKKTLGEIVMILGNIANGSVYNTGFEGALYKTYNSYM